MANIIWMIMGFIFCAIAGYGIGLRRGFKTYEDEYDRGYRDALLFEQDEIKKVLKPQTNEEERKIRGKKARDICLQLEELFEDENEIFDGGTY